VSSLKTEFHIAPSQLEPIRLQEYGVGIFNSAPTKSALKKAIKKGYVTVNGNLASTAVFINGGEEIKLEIPVEKQQKKKLVFPLKVLFEDDYIAAIHKPAGILVSGNGFYTISNALEQNLRKSANEDATIPQPVHRLDYATTGVLLIGKTNKSIRLLNQMFEQKAVAKTYYAICIGHMEHNGLIDVDIDGKNALTQYTVVESVKSERFEWLNLVKLDPKTGRRHQLRKHLSSIGNPILGDKDYGKEGLILKGKGMYLHARSVEFIHPFSGEKLQIESPFSKRFLKIFENLVTD
jgi:23S rRNA pseudouridine1911/1915/1917 synthase